MRTHALALAAVLVSTAAHAECPAPRTAISVRPLAFLGGGAALSVERLLTPPLAAAPRISLAAGPGVRFGRGPDYATSTLDFGVEAHLWLTGRGPFGCARGMVGPMLGARLDVARTHVTDEALGRDLGATWTFSESALAGWRFALGPVEVTPALGLVVLTDAGGGLAPYTRVTGSLGGTIGWMF